MDTIPVVSAEYMTRLQRRDAAPSPQIWELLDEIKDPEIPVVSIWDLGILQDVVVEGDQVVVVITPTYSGCPAMREIEADIGALLRSAGYAEVVVKYQLAPAWTTDWMSPEGKSSLRQYGIAPPTPGSHSAAQPLSQKQPACPQCGSSSTKLISEFGSTACKALYKCEECMEPFDYFKCI